MLRSGDLARSATHRCISCCRCGSSTVRSSNEQGKLDSRSCFGSSCSCARTYDSSMLLLSFRAKANIDWDSLGFGLKDVAGVSSWAKARWHADRTVSQAIRAFGSAPCIADPLCTLLFSHKLTSFRDFGPPCMPSPPLHPHNPSGPTSRVPHHLRLHQPPPLKWTHLQFSYKPLGRNGNASVPGPVRSVIGSTGPLRPIPHTITAQSPLSHVP